MQTKNYVSKREHKFLWIFALIWFAFVLVNFAYETTKSYNYSIYMQQLELVSQANNKIDPRFSGSAPYTIPGLHILSAFVFVSLLKSKRYVISSILTLFYFLIFLYGIVVRFDGMRLGGEEFSPQFSYFHKLYYGASDFDFLFTFVISILLFWQFSILLRILIKNTQRKNVLP